jgi:putative DNA primase/helicase
MYFNPQKESASTLPSNVAISDSNNRVSSFSPENPVFRAKELLSLQDAGIGINFDLTKVLALECVDEILEHWLPDGEQRGRQYVTYNPTRNDGELGSFTINTELGLWSDFATDDKGGDLISLIAYAEDIAHVAAAVKILELIAGLPSTTCAHVVERAARAKAIPVAAYTPIMPVPSNARTRPTFFGSKLGSPFSTWEYRNEVGELMFCMHRFNTPTGKSFLPQTYCADSSGHCDWRLQAPAAPRPAYGLDRLNARPSSPVLFTEGEKAADAAQRLFPAFVAVTTMNGAKSPEKTDFTPFAGREIYIAPDNDDAGVGYKDALVRLLSDAGANVKAVMRLDLLVKAGGPLPKGYDLADAQADGWTPALLADLGEALWVPIAPKDEPLSPLPPTDTAPLTATLKLSSPPKSKTLKSGAASNADSTIASAAAPKKRTPQEIARAFANTNHTGHLAAFNGQVVAYADGHWSPLLEDLHIKQPLLKIMGPEATASTASSITDLIKIIYAKSSDTFERNSSLICLNNGTLEPAKGELLGHSYDHYLTNNVDITYDPTAECPLWHQTLGEIFAPDADKAEKIQFLQEFIGYCLIPSTAHAEFLWLVGSGGNGKSLILSIVTALIGKANISYAQIENLDKAFVRAELQGKLINISAEMSASATQSDSYLKAITSGDVIQAERKFKDSFSFKPYCRIIGATNTLPRLLDHSDGFMRRAVIMRFNRQFIETEKDVNREARLMSELPGILNWALVGLRNLTDRGGYVKPSSSTAELKEYRVNSDPIRLFAEDHLVPTTSKALWVGGDPLYQRYREWSTENGFQCLASNQFATRLQAVGFEKVRSNLGRQWTAEYRSSLDLLLPTTSAISSELANKYNV